jgi:nitric oxide reductase subunit B
MKRLWLLFVAVLAVSFAILSWIGARLYREMPPLSDKAVTTAGDVVIDSGEVQAGRN